MPQDAKKEEEKEVGHKVVTFKDGATKNYIEAIILHKKCRSNICCKTPQDVEEGHENTNGETNQLLALKHTMIIHVKGLG